MKKEAIQIKKLELGPYDTNTYIVVCTRTGESILIDAPDDANAIIRELEDTKLKYIVITHNHGDHTGALIELKLKLDVPIAAHHMDAAFLPCPPDINLKDGDTILAGRIALKVLHTPGHTLGSICLSTGKYLFAGDTIFPGGPGNTITTTSLKQVMESITSKIMILPDDTIIYPGHGDSTILGKEKKEFAQFNSKPHDPGLHGDVLWLSS